MLQMKGWDGLPDIVLVVALVASALLGCGASQEAVLKRDVSRQVTPENETELRHSKIQQGMTMDQVRQAIGDPSDTERQRKPNQESWDYYELVVHDPPKLRGLSVWFADGKVIKAHVIN